MCYFILLLLVNFSLNCEWITISENSRKSLFENVHSNNTSTRIEFNLNGYELSDIEESGKSYKKISYWNEGKLLDVGKPELPIFTRLISLPNKGEISFEVIYSDSVVIPNIDIYPHQGIRSESIIEDREFTVNEQFYRSGITYPIQLVEVGEAAIMRDLRVTNVTVNPFQYNPVVRELIIFHSIELIVSCEGNDGKNSLSSDKPLSRSFDNLYNSVILNYDSSFNRDSEYHQPNYLFIYPDNPEVESELNELISWKKHKGFHTVSVNTSQIGTTSNSIRNYIQTAYNTWEKPPEFICLVGDAGGTFSIPTGHIDGGEGDHFYVLLEGEDILADAFIGRLSFNSIFELQTIIYKILHYEKEPYLDNTDWYNQILLVGDPSVSGQSCINTKINIRDMMIQHTDEFSFTEVYTEPWISQMSSSFDEGVCYFNYRGFYGMSNWTNSEINALNNGYMLPVAVLITCDTGSFEGTNDSRTEKFLTAGSPGNPKGAVAAIGSATTDTNTCFNNCIDTGIYYGIFEDKIYHLGGALNRGKLNLYTSFPSNPYNAWYKFSYWNNLIGDPGMEIWTGTPEHMIVNYSSDLPIGSNFFEVSVMNETRYPLENAWVTIMNEDQLFSTGFTDNSGIVLLPIDTNDLEQIELTVTKHDFIPIIDTIYLIQNDIFINVEEIEIDDDNTGSSNGNADSIINPGENIELSINLHNFGTDTATSVYAIISSDDEFITITDSLEWYGTIADSNSIYSDDDFDFSVDPNVLGGSDLTIDISIYDDSDNNWSDRILLNIEGANSQPVDYAIIDGNNERLDPGEDAYLILTLENIGSIISEDTYGELSSSNEEITILDSDGSFGNILPEEQATNGVNRFYVLADDNIIPGSTFILDIQIYNSNGYYETTNFEIAVGSISVTDPMGPDTYGYYCYDDGDINYNLSPSYNWVEIDPIYGGSGIIIPLSDFGDMGDIADIELPFNLKYYGINYTILTLCSNGWISPGTTNAMDFMNWSIPGPGGPSPLIAPFWDDLRIGNGRVCYFYDQLNNQLIIEWSNLINDFNNDEETFQIIIFDSAYYPTSTGDNVLLFQYNTINNVDQGSYGEYSNHGEFATVGLEDHTSNIGLEYTYSNQYPTSSKTLEDEMAILFTTSPLNEQSPYITVYSYEVNDNFGNNNGIINPGEMITLSLALTNIGNVTAQNVIAIISTFDDFVNVTDSVISYYNIQPFDIEEGIGNFIFEVSPNCPNQHNIVFDLNILAEGNYEWSQSLIIEILSPEITLLPEVINFDEIYIGYSESKELSISNTGSDILTIFDIYSISPEFTVSNSSLEVNIGDSQDIVITVNTSNVGLISDSLYIISDDPFNPVIILPLLGVCFDIPPPDISIFPISISESLEQDQISQHSLTISNIGDSELNIEVETSIQNSQYKFHQN